MQKLVAADSNVFSMNRFHKFLFILLLLCSKIYGQDTGFVYRITLCADVPDNEHPGKVYHNYEPGHVFIILEARDSSMGIHQSFVWGFYPRRPVSCILFRSAKSKLSDNSNREYDASVTKTLTRTQYEQAIKNAHALSRRKYHLNKYNCYDYAVDVFNSIDKSAPIDKKHTRFPFIFGSGGSPCVLYKVIAEMNAAPVAGLKVQIGKAIAIQSRRLENSSTLTKQ